MRTVVIATLVAACAQNAPTGPVVDSHVETFEIPGSPPPKLDVLFVLDDSAEAAPFAARTDELLRGLATAWPTDSFPPPDLHVAVATADPADGGALRTATAVHGAFIVDAHRPDYRSRDTNYDGSLAGATAALGLVGTTGGAPAPIDIALSAASSDFVRADALLAVVIVSAHDDASPSDPVALAGQLLALKPNPAALVVLGAYPANSPRLDAFVGQFPNRSATVAIDATSYTSLLPLLAQIYTIDLGIPCIATPLDLGGGRVDCQIELVYEDGTSEGVPACPGGDRCWTYRDDALNCTAGFGQITVSQFHYPVMPGMRGQCVVGD